jgi:serine phosphatase RsbU (regulator of sigma subunit)
MMPMSPESSRRETIGFQQEVARLQALLEASRRIHGALQLDDVLHCVLEIAVKEIEADGAFFTPSPALDGARSTAYGQVPLDPSEWNRHPTFPLHDKLGRMLTSLVVVRAHEPLSFEEHDFLEGLALQSAVAVDTARQHERLVAWERVQQDLASARAIQRSLLPQNVPLIPGYCVDYRSDACYEVGGDYVDILKLPDERYMMVVADVAGKGLASAMVSGSFRAAFRAMAITGLPLHELAGRMNELHYAEGVEARRRYVTAILLRLDAGTHTVECLNAGHNAGFLLDGAGGTVRIESTGPPLGMLPESRYEVERLELAQGARLLFYTDGLIEVFRDNEEFGEERLLAGFRGCTERTCGPMLDSLWQQLNDFAEAARQTDDMTALALFRQ